MSLNNTDPTPDQPKGCLRPLYGIALYQAVGWDINEHVFFYFIPVLSITLFMIIMFVYCVKEDDKLPVFTPTSLISMAVAIKQADGRFQLDKNQSLDPSNAGTRAVNVIYECVEMEGKHGGWRYITTGTGKSSSKN